VGLFYELLGMVGRPAISGFGVKRTEVVDQMGNVYTFCPSCKSSVPTLAINVEKGEYGVFYCHRCDFGKRKHVPHLLEALGIDKREALDRLEEIANSGKPLDRPNPPATEQAYE
jgi:hypothetical protein